MLNPGSLAGLAACLLLAAGATLLSRAPEPVFLLPKPPVNGGYTGSVAKAGPEDRFGRWNIVYHGTCCEGNLAAAGDHTYVLLPELTDGNDILRSRDDGRTWTRRYPMVDASVPYGIEGDLLAWGDDVIYFGTELAIAPVAVSSNNGDSWTLVQVPVIPAGNDQAWAYLAPLEGMCPVPAPNAKPYILAGWFRIGAAVIFSCDGGLTWPIQTPLVGNNGSGPEHAVCHQNATAPADAGDTRVADAKFASLKAGRHGTFGTDRRFYWTEPSEDGNLYVCRTADFGVTWEGTAHPVAEGPGSGFVVSHATFDDKGTLYVLHGDKFYVSFDQGRSFRYVHTMPRYGSAGRSDSGGDAYFAVHNGVVHAAVNEVDEENRSHIWYLSVKGLDTTDPVWHEEEVDVTDNVRLDFMYIVLNGKGVPTISYTTPTPVDDPDAVREVTTASLEPGAPFAALKATPDAGEAPLTVSLDASGSFDPEGGALSYRFEFGDGTPDVSQTTPVVSHVYATPGSFTAVVTVTDSEGKATRQRVEIQARPAGKAAAGAQDKFGGALGLGLLLGLAVLGGRRRRA